MIPQGERILVADIVECADLGVRELRNRLRFSLQPLAELRVLGKAAGRILTATARSRRLSRAL
jgi:hypothetical protein